MLTESCVATGVRPIGHLPRLQRTIDIAEEQADRYGGDPPELCSGGNYRTLEVNLRNRELRS
jgi:hypothetical protein